MCTYIASLYVYLSMYMYMYIGLTLNPVAILVLEWVDELFNKANTAGADPADDSEHVYDSTYQPTNVEYSNNSTSHDYDLSHVSQVSHISQISQISHDHDDDNTAENTDRHPQGRQEDSDNIRITTSSNPSSRAQGVPGGRNPPPNPSSRSVPNHAHHHGGGVGIGKSFTPSSLRRETYLPQSGHHRVGSENLDESHDLENNQHDQVKPVKPSPSVEAGDSETAIKDSDPFGDNTTEGSENVDLNDDDLGNGKDCTPISLLIRTFLTCCSLALAVYLPNFAAVVGFIGAFCSGLVSLVFPVLAYSKIFWLEMSVAQKAGHGVLLLFGLVCAIWGTVAVFIN